MLSRNSAPVLSPEGKAVALTEQVHYRRLDSKFLNLKFLLKREIEAIAGEERYIIAQSWPLPPVVPFSGMKGPHYNNSNSYYHILGLLQCVLHGAVFEDTQKLQLFQNAVACLLVSINQ